MVIRLYYLSSLKHLLKKFQGETIMKRNICRVMGILIAVFISLAFTSPAFSMDEPGFTIKRMVISKDVVDREPVGIGDFFSAASEKIYCFLELTDIETDTQVAIVWFWSNQEMARVELPILENRRWRTYSSKKLAGLKGNWRAELLDSSGILLNQVNFTVE